MELLVVRHAIAEDRETFRGEDALRPLTAEGRRRFEKGARGLATLVDGVDVMATSPLVRAVETGEIVAKALAVRRTVRLAELDPDADPAAVVVWLRAPRRGARAAIVGHEPHLSRLVAYLLAGDPGRELVALKKGGACLLALGARARPGGAELRWMLEPGQLRRLARG
jgi:phosphohistidine phosphatase